MERHTTKLGIVWVGAREDLYRRAVALVEEEWSGHRPLSVALPGGGTPQDWFRWLVAERALVADLAQAVHWTVSDERCVPLAAVDSNFGNAERLLMEPLGVRADQRHPWPVAMEPAGAARRYAADWAARWGGGRAYDVCFLGMGEDSHTASLFPGSGLLEGGSRELFAAVEVPGKGWRLTVTPAGLEACRRVVVLAPGAGKAAALRRGLFGPDDAVRTPIQVLARLRERVVWLLDPAAAEGLHAKP